MTITDHLVNGSLPVRIYKPVGVAAAGLVWAHGGGFAAGDLDMPEADWVARQIAARGIAVVSVDYSLAPSGAMPGVHFPVAADEVAAAFRWAAASDLTAGPWALGGASAGANLATGAVLRMLDAGATVTPDLVVLAYPTLLAVQPAPDAALRVALDADPVADRFGPDVVRVMYENYLGTVVANAPLAAVPGLASAADVAHFPPTLMINGDTDELRVSGEVFARTLAEAGRDISVLTEPGTQHGHLNRPDEPAASRSIARIAEHLLTLRA